MLSTRSIIFVTIQFLAIGLIAFTGTIIPQNIFFRMILIISLAFGIWAMIIMKFKFNIFPELMPGSRLVTSGPYRYVRHPMYTAVLIITLVWLINEFTLLRLAVWVILLTDLIIKFRYEEKILMGKYEDYKEYKKRTKAILPLVY